MQKTIFYNNKLNVSRLTSACATRPKIKTNYSVPESIIETKNSTFLGEIMNHIYYLLIFSIFIYLQTPVLAGDFPKPDQKMNENTILSLLEGLDSDNLGLKTSCAYMLGKLKVSDAVIPLMKILRKDESEQARISSALALYKIGTPLSINAVKQAIKFDESERVSNLATSFYNEYLRNKLGDEDKITDTTYVTLK